MNQYDWQPWFAWYPVQPSTGFAPSDNAGTEHVRTRKVWLRWIERRIVGAVAPNGDLTDYWEYRMPATPRPGK